MKSNDPVLPIDEINSTPTHFRIAGKLITLTEPEPNGRFKLSVDGITHEHYRGETPELARRIHAEVKSTLESLCVALGG